MNLAHLSGEIIKWSYLAAVGESISCAIWEYKMAAAAKAAVVLPRPVTFVTGNAKKLEEVKAIIGNSIPFKSLKLDRSYPLSISLSIPVFVNLILITLFDCWVAVPELQGEPEDISKEKARLAALQVHKLDYSITLLELIKIHLLMILDM